ncbi:MAG: GtrA family protein [Candidatus Promineifilaceae bacterium]
MPPDLSIVLPCYNEGPNIPLILERLRPFWPAERFELILVDNGSTDSSAALLAAECARPGNPFLRVVTVPRNIGYGHGLMSGLRAAEAPLLAYSHADIQTPPEDVFRAYHLLAERGLDPAETLVKGRRINRPASALRLTNGLAWVAQLALGQPMDDINGQPKLFPRRLLASLSHPPAGFAFDTYLLYVARLQGLACVDFPVDFGARLHGESKWAASALSRYKTIWAYLVSIFQIAAAHYDAPGNLLRQITRFLATGLLTNLVNYATFWLLLRGLGVHYLAASAAGFLAGFAVGFAVNRRWTFGAAGGQARGQLLRFLLVNLASLAANLAVVRLFTEGAGLRPELSQLIAIAVSTAINFGGSKFWAFREPAE